MSQYTVDDVARLFEEAGGDVQKVKEVTGLSRATVYRHVAKAEALRSAVVSDASDTAKGRQDGPVRLSQEAPLDLSPYVPGTTPKSVRYRPREPLFAALQAYQKTHDNVLMVGETSTGKTSSAEHLARVTQRPYLEVSCDALLGFQELYGQVNVSDGTSHFVEGLFLKFVQQASVVLLDEVNALDPARNFKLHQLLNSRQTFVKEADRGRGKLYRVHDDCTILLAANPPSGKYNGTNRFNVALLSRVRVLEFPEFTQAEVDAILPAHDEKGRLLKFYEEAREVIRAQRLRTAFSLRDLEAILEDLARGFTVPQALAYGFLAKVRLAAGEEAYLALYGLANVIWDLEGKQRV